MKKYTFFFLFPLLFISAKAQTQMRLGYINDTIASELISTDPLNGKQHYKSIPVSLKKGQGALFFIKSAVFKPFLILASPSGAITPGTKDAAKSQAAVTASSDTSFFLILTSAEENKTGKFTYGYKLLDSSQMVFKESYSTCERLAYLINQWQLEWSLIPSTKQTETDEDGVHEYKSAKNTFKKAGEAKITNHYEEPLFFAKLDQSKEAEAFYKKACEEVKACLDLSNWNISSEITKYTALEAQSTITHFSTKGGKPNEHLQSFKILLKYSPFSLSELTRGYQVLLIFN